MSESGTTRIPVPKSNGKMTIKLIGVISGKKVTESLDIRVKSVKSNTAKAPLSSRLQLFKEKMRAKWYVFRAQLKYWWLSRKKWQKALWIALLALWLGMLISLLSNKNESSTSTEHVQTAYLTAINL